MSIGLAIKTFFKIISDSTYAEKIKNLNNNSTPSASISTSIEKQKSEPEIPKPIRSDAITLLSVLQREARLIDFMMEDINNYQDAQIGAAVRDVQKKSKDVLQKMFAIEPNSSQTEGQAIVVPENFDQGQYNLSGKISGKGPYNGKVEHAGWKVTKTELPLWNGTINSIKIIAPIEVEVK